MCVEHAAISFFFFQAEDGIRDVAVTGVQTCALPILERAVVAGVLGRDALANRLGALELRASIEEAALLAAMQFELALGTFAVGIETEIGRASCRERV